MEVDGGDGGTVRSSSGGRAQPKMSWDACLRRTRMAAGAHEQKCYPTEEKSQRRAAAPDDCDCECDCDCLRIDDLFFIPYFTTIYIL